MTRSSTKELITPFKEPKREFRSSRKHFKTLSLDESRSPDFDLFSNQEEYSKEEVAKTMAKTVEQYMSKTRSDYGSGVARLMIEDKDSFELKGQFLKELHDNTFSGSDHEDTNEHIEKVLEIVDLFHLPNITIDQVMLRAFPMSLTGVASGWLRNKPSGSITTWEDLKTKSLDPFFEDYVKLSNLNVPLELRREQVDDLMPNIEEGEVVEKFRAKNDAIMVSKIFRYPSDCDHDKKIRMDCAYNLKFSCMIGFEILHANFFPIFYANVMSKKFHNSTMKDKLEYKGNNVAGALMNILIFVGTFSLLNDFVVLEDMDSYHDEGMGDDIFLEPFLREVGINERRFEGMITINNCNEEVTYQMVRLHPRFKHHTNKQCNKIPPLLKEDTMYLCLHSPKTMKETRSNTSYPEDGNTPYSSYKEIKYSGRYQMWSILQETLDMSYLRPWIRQHEMNCSTLATRYLASWSMGFPIDFFPVLFVIPRVACYLSHRQDKMSQDMTVGLTMRIPLLYRGEYSQWCERVLNYLEEKTDGEAMTNSIQNGLPNDIYSVIDSNKTAKDLWDALKRQMCGSEYGEQDRKAAILYEHETFKATEGEQLLDTYLRYLQVINDLKKCGYKKDNCDVNDALRYKKKAVVVTSDPLALVVETTKVSKRKEIVEVQTKSKGSDDEDISDLEKKAKVKDYNYYKTKMLLAKNDSDKHVLLAEDQAWMDSSSDFNQEINANMVVMAQIEKVLLDSIKSSSSAKETIAEVAYYTSESESDSEYETSEYYDNSTNYGLFVNDNDDQEIFHDEFEFASENFIENHINSQKDYDKSKVDHNDSEEKEYLVDKLIQKFNHKIAKCQIHIEKANQQSKDLENQNKDLQEKYDVLINQVNTFEKQNNEFNEQMKVLNEKNVDLLAQTKVLQDQVKFKHVVIETHTECQEKIDKHEILFDKMSRQLVEMNNNVLRLQEKILEKETKISELEGCVSNKDVEIEKCLERLNECENKLYKIRQTNQTIHMIMPSKDTLYNGRKGIGFDNPSYFEKEKKLRPSLYDEKVIGLEYTSMFLIHSDEALEIKKFKRASENKIEFALDYGNLNASYQTSSLKPYVLNVILEKIIIDLEDEVVSLLEKEKENLETIKSLKSKGFESSENAISETENQSENDCQVVEKECDNMENPNVIAPGMLKLNCPDLSLDHRFGMFKAYDETRQQNGVVERRNKTLVEAARTMLTLANLPLFLWAEAIATACFTQNRSIIHKHFDKTPYELMNKRKQTSSSFVCSDVDVIFSITMRMLKSSRQKGILECLLDIQKSLLEPDLSNLNEMGKSSNSSVSQVSETSKKDLEDLFHNFYDEYFDASKIMKSSTTNVESSNVEVPSNEEEVFHESSELFQEEYSSSFLNDDVQQSSEKSGFLHQILN
nr:putative ribonuclease H-like domain-containing protein [Tanacetum cinerariifolium]